MKREASVGDRVGNAPTHALARLKSSGSTSSSGDASRIRSSATEGRQLRARDILLSYIEMLGIPYVFGNPGTTELPLVEGISEYPSITYVLAIHEDISVAQATGYARASGNVGIVNLHAAPGIAHGLGNLYNAYRARVPLLVTAGQHHRRLVMQEPVITADLVEMMRAFTKWAYMVTQVEELEFAVQRAFKELRTPPFAPVFLGLPVDLMAAPIEMFAEPRVSAISPVASTEESVAAARDVLAAGGSVLILAGDGVGHANACAELAEVAELLGAEVMTEAHATTWNFPVKHPLFGGAMSSQSTVMRQTFDHVDTVLMVGVTSQAPVSRFDGGDALVPWRLRIVSMDDSAWELGKNQPIEVGLLGEVGANLRLLARELRARPIDEALRSGRIETITERNVARRRKEEGARAERRTSKELTIEVVAETVAQLLPKDFVLVDESISNRAALTSILPFDAPSTYLGANGMSLGHSVGTASGVHLAGGTEKIINIVGDGSMLYYPQALWSAANTGASIVFVVLNNHSYRVLKLIMGRIRDPTSRDPKPVPGLDLDDPKVDLVKLAEAFGVRGLRASTAAEFRKAFEEAVDSPSSVLIDAQIHQPAMTSVG